MACGWRRCGWGRQPVIGNRSRCKRCCIGATYDAIAQHGAISACAFRGVSIESQSRRGPELLGYRLEYAPNSDPYDRDGPGDPLDAIRAARLTTETPNSGAPRRSPRSAQRSRGPGGVGYRLSRGRRRFESGRARHRVSSRRSMGASSSGPGRLFRRRRHDREAATRRARPSLRRAPPARRTVGLFGGRWSSRAGGSRLSYSAGRGFEPRRACRPRARSSVGRAADANGDRRNHDRETFGSTTGETFGSTMGRTPVERRA